jgi:hypothetical protein
MGGDGVLDGELHHAGHGRSPTSVPSVSLSEGT